MHRPSCLSITDLVQDSASYVNDPKATLCRHLSRNPPVQGFAFRPPSSSFANTFRVVRGAVDMPSSITEEDSQAEAVFRHAASCQHDFWRAASVPDVWCSSGRSLSQLSMACSCYFSSIAPTQIWPRGDLALPDKVLRKIALPALCV